MWISSIFLLLYIDILQYIYYSNIRQQETTAAKKIIGVENGLQEIC